MTPERSWRRSTRQWPSFVDRDEAIAAYEPAAREALGSFPIEPAGLEFVNVSENVTFKVADARDGAPYVLRLHRPGYHDDEALRSEPLWTSALARAGVAVPQPVAARSGGHYVRVEVTATGERRNAGLARWIDGELLADVVAREPDPAINAGHFERLGAIMADLHDQASGWTPPAAFKRHSLDADGLMGPAPFWGPFWDHPAFSAGERTLLLTTRDAIHAALLRHGRDGATYSLIHADLHPGNVLIDGERLAVIDFDDTGFGWHAYDMAVALVFHQEGGRYERFRDALLAGYRRRRPFAESLVQRLPMFMLVRRLVQIGWLLHRPELGQPPDLRARMDAILEAAARFEPPC